MDENTAMRKEGVRVRSLILLKPRKAKKSYLKGYLAAIKRLML